MVICMLLLSKKVLLSTSTSLKVRHSILNLYIDNLRILPDCQDQYPC